MSNVTDTLSSEDVTMTKKVTPTPTKELKAARSVLKKMNFLSFYGNGNDIDKKQLKLYREMTDELAKR